MEKLLQNWIELMPAKKIYVLSYIKLLVRYPEFQVVFQDNCHFAFTMLQQPSKVYLTKDELAYNNNTAYTINTISASKLCFWSCCWDKVKKFCSTLFITSLKRIRLLTTGGVHSLYNSNNNDNNKTKNVIGNFKFWQKITFYKIL